MAVTISIYNHTAKKFAAKEVTLTTLKLQLLNNSATFDATHTALTSVNSSGSYQVSGNGWTEGGETLANVAVTTVTTNDAMLDANDISKTATGGAIGPAYKAVLYDDTDASDAPLAFIDFGASKQADTGTAFIVSWAAGGIFSWTVT